MAHRDTNLAALDTIISEFKTFIHQHGGASETDTRVKVIDRILKDVCGWHEIAGVTSESLTLCYNTPR